MEHRSQIMFFWAIKTDFLYHATLLISTIYLIDIIKTIINISTPGDLYAGEEFGLTPAEEIKFTTYLHHLQS